MDFLKAHSGRLWACPESSGTRLSSHLAPGWVPSWGGRGGEGGGNSLGSSELRSGFLLLTQPHPQEPGLGTTGQEQETLYLGVREGGSHLDGWSHHRPHPHIPLCLKKIDPEAQLFLCPTSGQG